MALWPYFSIMMLCSPLLKRFHCAMQGRMQVKALLEVRLLAMHFHAHLVGRMGDTFTCAHRMVGVLQGAP